MGFGSAVNGYQTALHCVGRIGNVVGEVAQYRTNIATVFHARNGLERRQHTTRNAQVVGIVHPGFNTLGLRASNEIEGGANTAKAAYMHRNVTQITEAERLVSVFRTLNRLIQTNGRFHSFLQVRKELEALDSRTR